MKAEDPNRVGDLARDLSNLWAKDESALKDLVDDLQNLTLSPPPLKITRELGVSVSECLTAKPINQAATSQLASQLFVVMNSSELSRRQVEQLTDEIGNVLRTTGGEAAQIDRVEQNVEALHGSVSVNLKRWYHLY